MQRETECMKLSDGTTLQRGKYRIERFLGQGGFGITYLAYQPKLKRRVVIKEFFIKDFCSRDSNTSQVTVSSEGGRQTVDHFREKFIREAQTIAGLEHPHIIPIYDVFEENGTAYYVMKYLSGGSLSDKLKERLPSPLTEREVLRYLRQVADALAYVHARNKMHLDVKPGNIMLSEKDEAVLIDFGLVKQYDEEGNQMSRSSTIGGYTPRFSPMEQMQNGGALEFLPATDIYALGATFYNLLVGQYPPEAADVNEYGLPPLPKHISPVVAVAIEKAMQPKRKDRPQTVAEFLQLLEKKPDSTNGKTKVREEKKKPEVNVKPKKEEKKKEDGVIDVEIVEEFPPKQETEKPVNPEQPSVKKPLLRLSNFWIGVLLIPVLAAIGLWSESLLFDEYVNLWQPSDGGFLPFLLWPFLLAACLYGRSYIRRKQPRFWGRLGLFFRLLFILVLIAVGGCLWRYTYLNNWREVSPIVLHERVAEPVEKETVTVNGFDFKMVKVKGSTFQMGATTEQSGNGSEKLVHRVTLSNYAISETEVTQGLWKAVMGSNPSKFKGNNKPVESVSWNECQEFIRQLNSLTGRRFRLPTEAEWEFAARGGRNSVGFRYAGGDDLRKVGIYSESVGDETYPVKSKMPNELGLYDMSGNVQEWCADYYGEYPPYRQTNPTGPSFGSSRVVRGGHWKYYGGSCQISERYSLDASYSDSHTGFRLAL